MPSAGQIEKPAQHPIWLTFYDKVLEKEFRENYENEIRSPLFTGMIISLVSWLSVLIPVFYVVDEKVFSSLALTTILAIVPFFVFVAFATRNNRFKGAIHTLGALTNFWAGLYAIYLCSFLPGGDNLTLPALIFIVFFGSYLVRLRWVAGFLAALSYTAAYHIYMANYSDLSTSEVIMNAFVCWLTLVFAILAGHSVEQNNRIRFVQSRTINKQSEIIQLERDASEKLLMNLLPPFIAQRLKEKQDVIADSYNDASVMFVDITGFTELSTRISAVKVVELLNKVFSRFDELTEKYELEKIKTIGDGYMVAGGLTKNRIEHLVRMGKLALEIVNYVENDAELQQYDLHVRIGINAGHVVAGVIGINKSTYDLWGSTVNIASRMETAGISKKITVSEVVKMRLESQFTFEKRPLVPIKGLGETQTYFLTGIRMES